jgi:hypothetical protein
MTSRSIYYIICSQDGVWLICIHNHCLTVINYLCDTEDEVARIINEKINLTPVCVARGVKVIPSQNGWIEYLYEKKRRYDSVIWMQLITKPQQNKNCM